MARVLVVDDDPGIRRALRVLLEQTAHEVTAVGSGEEALAQVEAQRFDVVFLDQRLPGLSGIATLQRIRACAAAPPVVMMTAFGEAHATIEAMKLGAFDFALKPVEPPRLLELLRKAGEARLAAGRLAESGPAEGRAAADPETAHAAASTGILSVSARMHAVYKLIGLVASSSVTVLIRGESGTGKELVARAIHEHSARAAGPFVAVNCAAIPDTLLEGELFGHEAGAFTGAVGRRPGKLEQAHGGTLFLDEVGDMSPQTQAKILRVLQQQSFERLGGQKTLTVDVRVVAATNRDLDRLRADGRFREDLFYRLKVVTIDVPPLRERREDIPLLAEHFVRLFSARPGTPVRISPEAVASLMAHDWPGNVREFEHCLRQAVVLNRTGTIMPDELALPPPRTSPMHPVSAEPLTAEVRRVLAEHHADAWPVLVHRVETDLIRAALEQTGGNLSKGALLLGMSRPTLREKCAKYGIRAGLSGAAGES